MTLLSRLSGLKFLAWGEKFQTKIPACKQFPSFLQQTLNVIESAI